MGAYEFIKSLHERGGTVVNLYICMGGTHIEYTEPNEIEIKDLARRQEMVTMQEDGVIKTLLGLTTLEEVERLTGKINWLR